MGPHLREETCLVALVAAALVLGCSGAVQDGPASGSGNDPGGTSGAGGQRPSGGAGGGGGQPVAPGTVSAAVAPMRRLTRNQYRNTVRDLLGVQEAVAPGVLPGDDTIADRFYSNTISPLQAIDVGKYADAADAVATRAIADLTALLPCDPRGTGDGPCARAFIESFGKRAYRRPLTAAEVELLEGVYAQGGDFPTGVRLVIAGLLQSPKFLYLDEPVPADAGGKIVAVDGWAMASRLSYFLLDTMPDGDLFAAAEKGLLATADQIEAQARRLMADARFRATLGAFHQQWLQLETLPGTEKDPQLFPQWNPALREAMGEETRRFVEQVLVDGDGRLDTLLSAPFTFVDASLAGLYGLSARPSSWQRVELPPDERAGLLTQGGLMATLAHDNRTSYILRGKMVREALLCTPTLPPPPDTPAEPTLEPGASARARAEEHRRNPACAVCHDLFDPIGFAFENYDATGGYRTADGAGPIDARVTLTQTANLDGRTAGNAVELARLLAEADEVRGCVARQWMRFGLGRDDAAEDQPSLAGATRAFEDGGARLPALLVQIARSDAFRFQKVAQ